MYAIVCCKNVSCKKRLRIPRVRCIALTKLSVHKRPELYTFLAHATTKLNAASDIGYVLLSKTIVPSIELYEAIDDSQMQLL